MPPDTERPLTTRQAAQILGVSTSTVVAYSNKGLLRSFRLPSGHRRFRRADVEALTDTGCAA